MRLIFEKSVPGRNLSVLPSSDVPEVTLEAGLQRTSKPRLPEISEGELSRHYTELSQRVHGVNKGFYPLGSCTMKYNPRINEEMAALPGFTGIHPLQGGESVQGCLEVLTEARKALCEITGMDNMSFQPAAGAHGEFAGLLLIKKYHEVRGDVKRTKIIVPDSAHGTNPASATMAGYEVISIASTQSGMVDLGALRAVVGEDTAGLMLTNPNTVGLFDENILEITKIVKDAGGLCYYDGANLNAVMGIVRPGDMGFDVIHLNLHKTFSTPHGGGGPGSGPVGCKAFLAPYLPKSALGEEAGEHSIGQLKGFYGNFLVVVKALTYIKTLGREGIPQAATQAVLNANYMMHLMKKHYEMAYDRTCMHEFVLTLEGVKKDIGVSALDIAKALLDHGMHPPTMYFPLIVHEALMIEPTETETKETLEAAAQVFIEILQSAKNTPEDMHHYPRNTAVRRLDEVGAARNPKLHYNFDA